MPPCLALFGLVVAAVFLLPLPGTLGVASDAMLISHSTHVSHSTTAVGSRYCSTTVSVPTSLSYNTEPLRTMLGLPTSFSFGSSFVTSTLAPSNLTHVLVTFVAGSDAFISVVPSGSTLQLWKWYSGSPPALLQVLQTPSYQKTVGLSSIGYGEYTGTTSLTLELYEIPLKTIGGGGGGGGPVIIFASYSASWAVGAYTVASATAGGHFYVNYGQDVSGLYPNADSRSTGIGWAECTASGPTAGVGTSVAYAQQNLGAALDDCPVTTATALWPSVGVDLYFNIYYPTSFPGAKWVGFGCGCSGVSFSFPSP